MRLGDNRVEIIGWMERLEKKELLNVRETITSVPSVTSGL